MEGKLINTRNYLANNKTPMLKNDLKCKAQ